MMEINFRAWVKPIQIFVNRHHGFMIDVSVINFEEKWLSDYEGTVYEFREIVLMQSTGLKDMNGKEIYEGDILYFEPFETHSNDRVVEYIDGAYHGRLIRNGYSELLAECVYETRVIGNIYENPELLEVTK